MQVEGINEPRRNTLWVGNRNGEVSIDHPALDTNANGVGHIIFSPAQARGLAQLLHRHADIAEGGKQCVHCGCTEHTPCMGEDIGGERCYWTMFDRPVCCSEACITAEHAYLDAQAATEASAFA